MKDLEPNTPEERAIHLILNAKIETDEDYIALAKLIDDEVSTHESDLPNTDLVGLSSDPNE